MIHLIIQDQFYTIQNLQRSPISQTSNWSGTFFAVSYSKPALPYQQNNTLLMMVDRDVGSALGRAQLLADQEVKNSIYARFMSSVEIGVKN